MLDFVAIGKALEFLLWFVGLGNPLSPERTRMLLALRINVLAKGYSGISLETLQAMIQAFNGKLQLTRPIRCQIILPKLICYSDHFFKRLRVDFWLILLSNLPCPHAASCLSFVPEKGTVGASGDLAPLSHLALGLMGEGKMWSPKSGWADAKYVQSPFHSFDTSAL